ncbi:MAG: cobalt-zinc-cadmium efflux system outer membrane protein [Verrucomicrobiales bacterium]|jgi:cobalt-zinc-cadmium efflux system outer membrane protein
MHNFLTTKYSSANGNPCCRRWPIFAVSLAVTLLAGCKTYRPDPLDLPAHAEAWRAQSVSSEKVATFAKSLAEFAPDTVAFNPKNGLTLGEGELVALVFNPDLRIARSRAGVAEATAKYAGLWDDPELSFDVLKISNGVPDPWIVGSALSVTIPVSGRLRVEKKRAKAEMHAELDRVAEAEWQVQRDLRDAWVAWSAQRLHLQETEKIVKSLDSIVKSTSQLAEAGELLKTEAALFSIERESRRAELGQLRGEVAEGTHQIRALLGLSPEAPVDLIPALTAVGSVSGSALPDDTSLTLARLRSEYAVAEQTLLREVRKQYPDVTIGPQGESDEGQSRIGFVGGIPVPILNSNKGGIAKARAEREVAKAAFEIEYEKISGRLAALRARLNGVRARSKTMKDSLVPMVDRQVTDASKLVELGEGGSLVLLESLVRAHEAKLKLIDIRAEESQTSNEIQFLLGSKNRKSNTKKN